jgi:hypothetical protein
MLNSAEIRQIEAGLTSLSDWSDSMLVPFQATRLSRAKVVWLNERWFLERQIDVLDCSTRKRVVAWLIDEFAYCVPAKSDPHDAYVAVEKIFGADRYGGSGLVPHGGSGRAGISGRFQVKGIGVTPLVGNIQTWSYSHGCSWLEECLREAICAEVAIAEFPHEGVPVIAVIDAGMNYRMPDGELGERRGLMVRPCVVRPAHLERASMFAGSDSHRQEAAAEDVQRVRDAIGHFEKWVAPGASVEGRAAGLEDFFFRISEQIAFGQVHRLCHGFFTSNMTLSGELLDFGSFRSLPDWAKVFTQDHMPGFGGERHLLKAAVKSLCYFYNKYKSADSSEMKEAALLAVAERALAARFDMECLRVWNLQDVPAGDLRDVVLDAMRRYYEKQQQTNVSLERGFTSLLPWLGNALDGRATDAVATGKPTIESETIERIENALVANFGADAAGVARARRSRSTARRLLMPRDVLYREALQETLYGMLGGQNQILGPEVDRVADTIRSILSAGRRHWPRLGIEWIVLAQASWGYCSAVFCRDATMSKYGWWVETIRCQDHVRIFEQSIPSRDLHAWLATSDDRLWTGFFPANKDGSCEPEIAALVKIPTAVFWYPA